MPRGRGRSTRTKVCGSAERDRQRRLHPGIVIEPATGPSHTYRQTTLDPRSISSTSSHRSSEETPTDRSSGSRRGREEESDERVQRRCISLVDGEADVSGEEGEETEDEEATHRGRGPARPISPRAPGSGKLECNLYGGRLVGAPDVASFFTTQIRRNVYALWPHYENVPQELKDRIWESFLNVFVVPEDEGAPERARIAFEKDCKKKYRDLLGKAKRAALKKAGADDVAGLRGTEPPQWVANPDVWQQFVDYWNSDEQRAISERARRNRMSARGRPDGRWSTHGLGSKSLHQRMYEEERRTGRPASGVNILLDVNKKKDKATQQETGEYYDPNLNTAIVEYNRLFQEQWGPDADPSQAPWDRELWTSTEPVRSGLGKGRILGVGYAAVGSQLLHQGSSRSMPSSSSSTATPEGYAALEAKNRELEQMVLQQGQMQAGYQAEIEQLNSRFQSLEAMMRQFMGASASAGQSSTGNMGSASTAGSAAGTATGLLASMHPPLPPFDPLGSSQPPLYPSQYPSQYPPQYPQDEHDPSQQP